MFFSFSFVSNVFGVRFPEPVRMTGASILNVGVPIQDLCCVAVVFGFVLWAEFCVSFVLTLSVWAWSSVSAFRGMFVSLAQRFPAGVPLLER